MADYHVLRVFTAADGSHGNELGVFLDGDALPAGARQQAALDLGFAETVFVDDENQGRIQIFTPGMELPFAGHPCVGTAWLLREQGYEAATLKPPAGDLPVRFDDADTFVSADPAWSPPFEYRQYESPAEVDALDAAEEAAGGWVYGWAWADEPAGQVRARSFVAEAGISEDEATGSAALALCAQIGKPIEVRQGKGSLIRARPLDGGRAEVGGFVAYDEARVYNVDSR